MRFRICSLLFVFVFSSAVFSLKGDKFDTIAQKVRMAKGKKVIICSPNGKKEGSIPPSQAMSQLKRGMTIKFLPGDYGSEEILLNANSIIVEGEPGKYCGVALKLTGKKCVVRNLCNYRSIYAPNGITIVDSIIGHIKSRTENDRAKVRSVLYNSVIGCIGVYCYFRSKNEMAIKNCVFVGGDGIGYYSYGLISADSNTTVSFEKCILSTSGSVFSVFNGYSCGVRGGGRPAKLILKDCFIYGGKGLGTSRSQKSTIGYDSKTQTKIAHDLRSLKKMTKVSISGKTKVKKPEFEGTIDDIKKVRTKRSRSDYSCYTFPPKCFTLKEDSPGKKMGLGLCSVNKEGYPAPPEEVAKK